MTDPPAQSVSLSNTPVSPGGAAGPAKVEARQLLNTLPGPSTKRPARYAVAARSPGGLENRIRFYEQLVAEMKASYGISIRRWRTRMSGVAYELRYRDGHVKRMVTAPRPRSPVSASIFLHEVGHHAIGFRKHRPRCLEEFHVWQWAFREMTARCIAIDERVLRHYRRSMYHYVRMAKKRGIKVLPPVLEQFEAWPG